MKVLQFVIFLMVMLVAIPEQYGQVISEAAARAEIRKRGLDEEEVLREIEKRGVDLNTLDVNDPVALSRAETVVREVIADLEAKTNNPGGAIDTTQIPIEELSQEQAEEAARQSDEVIDAIREGSTLEEAVSETLQEGQEENKGPAPIYGQQIFRNKSLQEYRRTEGAKPPESYILGPGDKIAISIWGISEYSAAFEISSDGYIKPDITPRIYLTGLTIGQAKEKLRSTFRQYSRFNNSDFAVTLSTARTITVNIVGEVENPGSFTISAVNTAFNALVAAGGPSRYGSVRSIQLISGAEVKEVDVYAFLQNPVIAQKLYLQENDYLSIPIAQKVVGISGAVRRPMQYELKGNEGLNELIEFAGGLTDRAIRRNIQIVRIENDEERIIDVNYRELQNQGRNFTLYPGDQIRVKALEQNFENYVRITGAVETPGEYAWIEGMRVSDLVNKITFENGAILDSAYLKRINADNVTTNYRKFNLRQVLDNTGSDADLVLQARDEIILRSIQQYSDAISVEINGAVRDPGIYPFADEGSLRVSDLVFFASGLAENAADIGYIYRKDPENTRSTIYLEVNIPGSTQDPLLKGGDRLQIISQALYEDEFSVAISGAVRNPDTFRYNPTLRISDVIRQSGGFRLEASPSRVDVFRVDLSSEEETKILAAQLAIDENFNVVGGASFALMPFDQIYVRTRAEFELQRMVNIIGEVKYPGNYAILNDNEKISSIIRRAGGLTDEAFLGGATLFRNRADIGYVIFDLEEALDQVNSHDNIIVQAGDNITVPKKENLVTIIGATKAAELYPEDVVRSGKFTVPFESGKNAKYYIDEYAGGIADNGDAGKVSVTYPTGELKKSGRFLFFRKYPEVKPGSVIKVGAKDKEVIDESGDSEKEDIDWGQVLSDSVAQAMSVLTLVLLLQRID